MLFWDADLWGKSIFTFLESLYFYYTIGIWRWMVTQCLVSLKVCLAQCNCFACIPEELPVHCMFIGNQYWLISSHLICFILFFTHNRNFRFLPWRPFHQASLSMLVVLSVHVLWSSWIAFTILVCWHKSCPSPIAILIIFETL